MALVKRCSWKDGGRQHPASRKDGEGLVQENWHAQGQPSSQVGGSASLRHFDLILCLVSG